MRWKIIALGSSLHSRALACSPRSTAFYKGHGRSESLRQFGRPSPYIDGESGCLIQTDPPPIRRRCGRRRQVSASIRLRASSRIRRAYFPKRLVSSAFVPERSFQARSVAAATSPAPLAGKFNQIGRRPLYRAYEDARASLSNSYAPTRTLALRTMEDLGCFKSSHTFLPSRLRTRVRLWRMPGGAQQRIKRAGIGPKRIICAVPVRNGARNTLKSPQGPTLG